MKFLVSRTSYRGNEKNKPPCDGAVQEQYTWTQQYAYTEAEFEARWPNKIRWREVGRNHRVTEDGIARDFVETGWILELDTLEDLLRLASQTKQELAVAASYPLNDDLPTLEICDDYRE